MKPDRPPCMLLTGSAGLACRRCGFIRSTPPAPFSPYIYARCVSGDRMADRELDLERWNRLGRANLPRVAE